MTRTKFTDKSIGDMMHRLRVNVQWKYIFQDEPDDSNYISRLHINTGQTPGAASKAIKQSMNRFELAVLNECTRYHGQKIVPNLTRVQAALVKKIKKNQTFKIISAD